MIRRAHTRAIVELTATFERNLEQIAAFLADADADQAFDALLAELAETVIPNLERFPSMGRSFLARRARSVEVANGLERLRQQLTALSEDGEIREYVMEHFLVLYVYIESTVSLLSIRHHRQLAFDFQGVWAAGE